RREPIERRREPEVVERARSELDGEAAHVLQRLDDLLAQTGRGPPRLLRRRRVLDLLQSEQDRGQRLAGLVVQLAREAAPLELLARDDPPQGIAGDTIREVDRNGRAGGERLRQPQILVR